MSINTEPCELVFVLLRCVCVWGGGGGGGRGAVLYPLRLFFRFLKNASLVRFWSCSRVYIFLRKEGASQQSVSFLEGWDVAAEYCAPLFGLSDHS